MTKNYLKKSHIKVPIYKEKKMSHSFNYCGPPPAERETCILHSDMLYAEYICQYLARQHPMYKTEVSKRIIQDAMVDMFAELNKSARASLRR